jgi:large subunit ribosomal protein L6
MSRIGKIPVAIPKGVEVLINGNDILVKGPKGSLNRKIDPSIKIEKRDELLAILPTAQIKPSQVDKRTRALWGLSRQLVNNMVKGVSEGFQKTIVITGNGYKSSMVGGLLQLSLGYSHDIMVAIPEGLEVKCEKNEIHISGRDKELVGLFAAQVRKHRPTEPYKGKGLEYKGVVIIKKVSKKK